MPFNKKTAQEALRKRWEKTPLRYCPRCGHLHRCVAKNKTTRKAKAKE